MESRNYNINIHMFKRQKIAKSIIRIGQFVQSLAVVVMRPKDLVEYGREFYASTDIIKGWSQSEKLAQGLHPEEKELLKRVPIKRGKLLLLGVGGGRDAIPLAEMGFQITGIDNVPQMIKSAQENLRERGLEISGLVQDITCLELEENHYDVVWLCSNGMYSGLPTRNWRVKMLKKINQALKSDGYVVCQFLYENVTTNRTSGDLLRKIFAYLSLGNIKYERGDRLYYHNEFVHFFSSEKEVKTEFGEAGFKTYFFNIFKSGRGGAILQKALPL